MKLKIFSFKGIPTYIHWSWLLMFALLSILSIIAAKNYTILLIYPLVFIFVLLHEYGHALTAKLKYNYPVGEILLHPLGGTAKIGFSPFSPKDEFIITIFGPAVNLAFVILSFPALFLAESMFQEFLLIVFYLNLVLFVFNIIPIFPMDGGRILRSLINIYKEDTYNSTCIAIKVGTITGFILGIISILFLKNPFVLAIIIFMWMEGRKELAIIEQKTYGFLNLLSKISKHLNKPELMGRHHPKVLYEACLEIKDSKFREEMNIDVIQDTLECALAQMKQEDLEINGVILSKLD